MILSVQVDPHQRMTKMTVLIKSKENMRYTLTFVSRHLPR